MKKTIIATLLALSALLSAGTYVCAYGGGDIASPYYLYTYTVKITLTISGTTAYCESSITCDSTVNRIYGTQYLERKMVTNGNMLTVGVILQAIIISQ